MYVYTITILYSIYVWFPSNPVGLTTQLHQIFLQQSAYTVYARTTYYSGPHPAAGIKDTVDDEGSH